MTSITNAFAKREELWHRQEGRCWLCGEPMNRRAAPGVDPDAVTFDHVIPRASGGCDRVGNLRLAHRRCNLDRGVTDAALLPVRAGQRRSDAAQIIAQAMHRAGVVGW